MTIYTRHIAETYRRWRIKLGREEARRIVRGALNNMKPSSRPDALGYSLAVWHRQRRELLDLKIERLTNKTVAQHLAHFFAVAFRDFNLSFTVVPVRNELRAAKGINWRSQ